MSDDGRSPPKKNDKQDAFLARFMSIIFKKSSTKISLLGILAATALQSIAAVPTLPITQSTRISINTRNNRVIANDLDRKIIYLADSSAAIHLKKSDDTRLLSYKSATRNPKLIILTREPSRPGNMGRGYCGAGHEDYLLLVELMDRKLVLRDKLLLQSCLEGILIYSDAGGDDPIRLLRLAKDGSLNFTWEKDYPDQMTSLSVRHGRFVMTLVPSTAK